MHGIIAFRLTQGDEQRFFMRNPKNKIKHARFGALSFVNDGHDLHGSQVRCVSCGSV